MASQNINLLNDVVFKYIFGNQKNEQLLIYLLNAILKNTSENKITWIQILNPYNLKEAMDDKLSILDVKAKDESGKLYNIEVQVMPQVHYVQRIMYYLSRLYTEQLKEKSSYESLKKTISISILDKVILKEEPRLHNIFRMLNIENHKELTDIFELHFIELTKFNKEKPKELQTSFEKWLHVLKFGEKNDKPVVEREILKYRRGSKGQPWHFLDFSNGKGTAIINELDYDGDEKDLEREEQKLKSDDILAIKGLVQFEKFPAVVALGNLIENWYISDF